MPHGPRSILVLPVPAAEPTVRDFRLQYDPSARAGMPAHITLVYPFLPPGELDSGVLECLHDVTARIKAFPFELERVAWFGRRVMFLAPVPAAPIIALAEALAAAFGMRPHERRGPIKPHLTVGRSGSHEDLEIVAQHLSTRLPIAATAREVLLLDRDDRTPWKIRERSPLRG